MTSSGIAEHTDAEVLTSIVDGVNPEDGLEIDSPEPHAYALDDLQQTEHDGVFAVAVVQDGIPFHDH